MKNKIAITILGVFCSTLALLAQSADDKIKALINEYDTFELSRQYPLLKDSMENEMLSLVADALINHHFNQPEKACASFEKLFSQYHEQLGDNALAMLLPRTEDLVALGRFEEAKALLQDFIQQANNDELADFLRLKYDVASLKELFPKSELIRPAGDVCVPFFLKKYEFDDENVSGCELMEIPVTINGKTELFMLDTGAEFPFISRQLAEECKLTLIADSIVTEGALGKESAQFGVVDSIYVGDILYKNVLFGIRPDVPDNSSVDRKLGFGGQFLSDVGEFHIDNKEKQIVFPAQESELPPTGSNLLKEGLYLVEVSSGEERLMFLFDSGCSSNSFNAMYYWNHKEEVETKEKKRVLLFGVGGAKETEHYVLTDFPLKIGDKDFILNRIDVDPDPFQHSTHPRRIGELGLPFILSFDKLIVNYNKMFIKAE